MNAIKHISTAVFAIWALTLIWVVAGEICPVWREILAKIGYVQTWEIVGVVILPQAVGALKLLACILVGRMGLNYSQPEEKTTGHTEREAA